MQFLSCPMIDLQWSRSSARKSQKSCIYSRHFEFFKWASCLTNQLFYGWTAGKFFMCAKISSRSAILRFICHFSIVLLVRLHNCVSEAIFLQYSVRIMCVWCNGEIKRCGNVRLWFKMADVQVPVQPHTAWGYDVVLIVSRYLNALHLTYAIFYLKFLPIVS